MAERVEEWLFSPNSPLGWEFLVQKMGRDQRVAMEVEIPALKMIWDPPSLSHWSEAIIAVKFSKLEFTSEHLLVAAYYGLASLFRRQDCREVIFDSFFRPENPETWLEILQDRKKQGGPEQTNFPPWHQPEFLDSLGMTKERWENPTCTQQLDAASLAKQFDVVNGEKVNSECYDAMTILLEIHYNRTMWFTILFSLGVKRFCLDFRADRWKRFDFEYIDAKDATEEACCICRETLEDRDNERYLNYKIWAKGEGKQSKEKFNPKKHAAYLSDDHEALSDDILSFLWDVKISSEHYELFQSYWLQKDMHIEGYCIGAVRLPCKHTVGIYCMWKWNRQSPSCPLCRADLLCDEVKSAIEKQDGNCYHSLEEPVVGEEALIAWREEDRERSASLMEKWPEDQLFEVQNGPIIKDEEFYDRVCSDGENGGEEDDDLAGHKNKRRKLVGGLRLPGPLGEKK